MDKNLLDRIKQLGNSEDEELVNLSRVLFWGNSPTYEDLIYVETGARMSLEQFKSLKRYGSVHLRVFDEHIISTKLTVPFVMAASLRRLAYLKNLKEFLVKTQSFARASEVRYTEKIVEYFIKIRNEYTKNKEISQHD